MVSVEVSSLGKTSLHFVNTWAKINGRYYRNVLLMEGLFWILHLPAGRGCDTSSTRDRRATEASDARPHSALSAQQSRSEPIDYVVWGIIRDRVYKHHQITDVEELCQHVEEECMGDSLDPSKWLTTGSVTDSLHCSQRTFTLNITAFVHILNKNVMNCVNFAEFRVK